MDRGQKAQGRTRRAILGWLVPAVVACGVAGCGSVIRPPSEWLGSGSASRNEQSNTLMVRSKAGGQPANLSADDIVRVMRRIGFADPQIRNLAQPLRGALASSGAAAVVRGKQTLVMLAINDEYLFVQAPSQGSFIYDMKDKRFGTVPPMVPD